MSVVQTFKNLKRLRQIANVLMKQELGNVIAKMKLKGILPAKKKIRNEEFEKPLVALPERLRRSMEELGGGFVKIGQLLSMRYDFLPAEFCDEFSKLQDDVKPFSFREAQKIVEGELGKPLNQVFRKFEEKPVAAASIGQVHRAVLKSGHVVAVKVQRPGIWELFRSDIALLYYLASQLEKHIPETRIYRPVEIVKEFEKYTKRELDYMLEAKNIDSFHSNFKSEKNVRIPKVYWDYTTSKVITMDFITGVRLVAVKNFNSIKSSKKKMAEVFINAMIKQIFDDGLFHADPHPGNIFACGSNKIAFLDFGIVGRLTPDAISQLENLMMGMAQPNLDLIVSTLLDMGITDTEIDVKEFKADIVDMLGPYYNAKVGQINFSTVFSTAFTLGRKYNLKLPTSFILLAKSLTTMEGLAKKYLPEFDFNRFLRPKAEALIKKRLSPLYVLSNAKQTAVDMAEVIRSFPGEFSRLVRALKYGTRVNVDVDNKDIRQLTNEIDRSSNHLTTGMIMAALIIAAAVIILADVSPKVWGMPFLALLCIILVFMFALYLVFSMLKEKGGDY